MDINLHIERLVLDGVSLSDSQHRVLKTIIEAGLTTRLIRNGISDGHLVSGNRSSIRAETITLKEKEGPRIIGDKIAQSVCRGINL